LKRLKASIRGRGPKGEGWALGVRSLQSSAFSLPPQALSLRLAALTFSLPPAIGILHFIFRSIKIYILSVNPNDPDDFFSGTIFRELDR